MNPQLQQMLSQLQSSLSGLNLKSLGQQDISALFKSLQGLSQSLGGFQQKPPQPTQMTSPDGAVSTQGLTGEIQQAQSQTNEITQGIIGLLGSEQQEQQQFQPFQASTSSSITIPQGATLSGLAQQHGTTVQELLRLNPQIQNPNLIFAGQKLNIPGQQPQQALTSPTQIAEQANQFGQQFFEQLPAEVPERESTKLLNQFMEQFLIQQQEPPSLLNRQSMFAQLRGELGVDPLESRLAQLDSRIEQEEVGLRREFERIEGQPISTRVQDRQKRQREIESQRFRADLAVERNSIARRLDNKYKVIEMTMQFADADFRDAESRWEQQYNRQRDLMDLLFKLEEREIREEDRQRDIAEREREEAMTNINTITSLLEQSGKTFADLNPDQLRSVRQWELQAGLPMGTYENLLTGRPDKMLTSGSRTAPDGTQYFDFIFERPDGTRYLESVARGQVGGSSSTKITLNPTQKTNLAGAGFSTTDIGDIERMVNDFGIEITLRAIEDSEHRLAVAQVFNATTILDRIETELAEANKVKKTTFGQKVKSWWDSWF